MIIIDDNNYKKRNIKKKNKTSLNYIFRLRILHMGYGLLALQVLTKFVPFMLVWFSLIIIMFIFKEVFN